VSFAMIEYDDDIDPRISLLSGRVVSKRYAAYNKDYMVFMEALCKHLIKNPDPMIVPVYSFEVLMEPKNALEHWEYQYAMMRLGKLNHDEKMIISHLSSARYYPSAENLNDSRGKYPKLVQFVDDVFLQDRHHDVHYGNLMKDEDENYRLVDLESFWIGNSINHPTSAWITRS
jgi:hypothetical protein